MVAPYFIFAKKTIMGKKKSTETPEELEPEVETAIPVTDPEAPLDPSITEEGLGFDPTDLVITEDVLHQDKNYGFEIGTRVFVAIGGDKCIQATIAVPAGQDDNACFGVTSNGLKTPQVTAVHWRRVSREPNGTRVRAFRASPSALGVLTKPL